jgi:hypothetical protein
VSLEQLNRPVHGAVKVKVESIGRRGARPTA